MHGGHSYIRLLRVRELGLGDSSASMHRVKKIVSGITCSIILTNCRRVVFSHLGGGRRDPPFRHISIAQAYLI
jgi:hypothetical protein